MEKVQYQCCLLDMILSKQKYYLIWYNQLQRKENLHEKPLDRNRKIFRRPEYDNSKSFIIKFMQNTYTISYPEFEIHCIDKSDKDAILCNDIH